MAAKITWQTEQRRINDLIPYEGNPRQMTAKQVKDLTKSLKKFDLAEIPAINTDNMICAGHQRLKILQMLGRGEEIIDVRVPSRQLTDEEFKEYLLRSNRNTGEWDYDLLANFDRDFLVDVGWDAIEIDHMFELDILDKEEDFDVDKAIEKEPKFKIEQGDLFEIGQHRLMCGDSCKREDVERLMGEEKGSLGFTSPPYWVGKEYETQKSVEEIDEFIKRVCQSYNLSIRKDKSRIVINTGTGFTTSFDKKQKRQVLLLIDKWCNNFYSMGWNLRHIRHWIKEGQLISTSPKSDMIDPHCEFLGTFENDEGKEIDFYDKINDEDINILETFYNPKGLVLAQNRTGKKWALRSYWNDIKGNANQSGHCASFPLELVARHLLLYTGRNDIVVDLLGGSGSTMVACHSLNRQCRMMEVDERYCSVILERMLALVPTLTIKKNGEAMA